MSRAVKSAFRLKRVPLAIERLVPSRAIDPRGRKHQKYKQIAASIAVVGIIEPLIVFPLAGGTYRILDGHKRHDILLGTSTKSVECIISLDDENHTYNRRVNYLSPISEHHMILRALGHNSEDRIATVLNVDVGTIRKKRDLLNGVCKEAADLLKDHRVASAAFAALKRMKPVRQVEAAQLMVASNMYTGRFAAALLTGTRDEMLVAPEKDGSKKAANPEQRMRLQQEADNLLRDLKSVEDSYGAEVLTLSVSCKYIARLIGNARLRGELKERHPDVLDELESLLALVKSEVT
jgi:RepB plasmid partitioning protein/ParB-like nuclease domain